MLVRHKVRNGTLVVGITWRKFWELFIQLKPRM